VYGARIGVRGRAPLRFQGMDGGLSQALGSSHLLPACGTYAQGDREWVGELPIAAQACGLANQSVGDPAEDRLPPHHQSGEGGSEAIIVGGGRGGAAPLPPESDALGVVGDEAEALVVLGSDEEGDDALAGGEGRGVGLSGDVDGVMAGCGSVGSHVLHGPGPVLDLGSRVGLGGIGMGDASAEVAARAGPTRLEAIAPAEGMC